MMRICQRAWSRLSPRRQRHLKLAGATCGWMVCVWLLFCFLAVYSLTQRSRSRFVEPAPQVAGITIEDHRLKTADGEEVGIWYVSRQPRLPTVILIHGNGGHRRTCWPQAEILLRAGYSVLLISCRAHGDSTGQFNDFGWSARQDVVSAVTWLRSRQLESKIILWGASLGSAAAVFAADELRTDIAGYILECPYRDLDTAVWNRLQTYLPPLIDRACHIGMRLSARILMPHIDQISPLNHVDTIPKDVPVLILAGAADRRARPEEARALHARIKEHSRLEIIPRADHLQLLQTAPEKYEALVLEFLEKLR